MFSWLFRMLAKRFTQPSADIVVNNFPEKEGFVVAGENLAVIEKLRGGLNLETRMEVVGRSVGLMDSLYERVLAGGVFYVQDKGGDFARVVLFNFEHNEPVIHPTDKSSKRPHFRLIGKDE